MADMNLDLNVTGHDHGASDLLRRLQEETRKYDRLLKDHADIGRRIAETQARLSERLTIPQGLQDRTRRMAEEVKKAQHEILSTGNAVVRINRDAERSFELSARGARAFQQELNRVASELERGRRVSRDWAPFNQDMINKARAFGTVQEFIARKHSQFARERGLLEERLGHSERRQVELTGRARRAEFDAWLSDLRSRQRESERAAREAMRIRGMQMLGRARAEGIELYDWRTRQRLSGRPPFLSREGLADAAITAGGAYAARRVTRGLFRPGFEFESELANMAFSGFDRNATRRLIMEQTRRSGPAYGTMGPLATAQILDTLRSVTGSVGHANETLPQILPAAALMQLRGHDPKDATRQFGAALRIGELGGKYSPEALGQHMLKFAALQYTTHGQLSPEQFLTSYKPVAQYAKNWTDDSYAAFGVATAARGAHFGTGLRQLLMGSELGAGATERQVNMLRQMGLAPGSRSHATPFSPRVVRWREDLQKLAETDAVQFVEVLNKEVREKLRAFNPSWTSEQLEHETQRFFKEALPGSSSNGRGSGAFDAFNTILSQGQRIQADIAQFKEILKRAQDPAQRARFFQENPNAALMQFRAQWERLMEAMSAPVIEPASRMIGLIADGFEALGSAMTKHPLLASTATTITTALAGLMAALAAVSVAKIIGLGSAFTLLGSSIGKLLGGLASLGFGTLTGGLAMGGLMAVTLAGITTAAALSVVVMNWDKIVPAFKNLVFPERNPDGSAKTGNLLKRFNEYDSSLVGGWTPYNTLMRLQEWQNGLFSGTHPGARIDGHRAAGGPVASGRAYLVGERGPELFTPSTSGLIIPNDRLTGTGPGSSVDPERTQRAILTSEEYLRKILDHMDRDKLFGGGGTGGAGGGSRYASLGGSTMDAGGGTGGGLGSGYTSGRLSGPDGSARARMGSAATGEGIDAGSVPRIGGAGANASGMGAGGVSKAILDLAARGEAGRFPGGGFNTWFGGGQDPRITRSTVDQVLAMQAERARRGLATDVGRWQITRTTLLDFKRRLGLTGKEPFNAETQERIASAIIRSTGGDPARMRGRFLSLGRVSDAEIRRAWSAGGNIGGPTSGTFAPGVSAVPGGRVFPVTGSMGNELGHFRAGGRGHAGVDLRAPNGSPVYASIGGTVAHVGHHGGYGNTIDVVGNDGRVYRYAVHGGRVGVRPGQKVGTGQLIGTVGAGHVHHEIHTSPLRDARGHYVPRFTGFNYRYGGPPPGYLLDPAKVYGIRPGSRFQAGKAVHGSSAVAGARAMGGPVIGGKTYLVGEKGPELVSFRENGTVHPNGKFPSWWRTLESHRLYGHRQSGAPGTSDLPADALEAGRRRSLPSWKDLIVNRMVQNMRSAEMPVRRLPKIGIMSEDAYRGLAGPSLPEKFMDHMVMPPVLGRMDQRGAGRLPRWNPEGTWATEHRRPFHPSPSDAIGTRPGTRTIRGGDAFHHHHGDVEIHVNGSGDPEKVAKVVMAELTGHLRGRQHDLEYTM